MKKLLIANRGEIARRVIRSAHACGIATVAVYSDADAQSLHVREAGSAVALGGTSSADSYLRFDKLLNAARVSGADAIHPGYGFLSENAEFAQAVVDAGLIWVGPPAGAIRALGSKSGAKTLAMEQGVPCLPGYFGDDQSTERLTAEAKTLGVPLMVKAVAGGGGRGMRLVTDLAQLAAALQSARSEALASFGNGDLLLERALLAPRHVEVQVFADTQGHCIHLGERDCSVQRRHQKIIEEAPSPAVSPALRERMGTCAVALAQAAGYVGAGTVEFLVDGDTFYLMEMNTRLQVEHPVTELVTGLDLVAWQLRVARGEALPLTQSQVVLNGHAIEVRLCAEDEHYTPHTGVVRHFTEPAGEVAHFCGLRGDGGLRFDHMLAQGAEVTPHYDAMLGKLMAWAPTRTQAIDRLGLALAQTQLLGLPTNRAFTAACLGHPVFRAGEALIPFLQTHGDALRERLVTDERAVLRAALLAVVWADAPDAAVLPPPFERPVRLRHRGQVLNIECLELGGGRVRLRQGDDAQVWQVHRAAADGLTVHDGTRQRHVRVAHLSATRWHVQVDGADLWLDDASHEAPEAAGGAGGASDIRAPFNGKVVAVRAAVGDAMRKGDVVVVIESMKLEHSLAAAAEGVLAEMLVSVGQQVAPGQRLARLEVTP